MPKPFFAKVEIERLLYRLLPGAKSLIPLVEGEESQAFRFENAGSTCVLRVNSSAEGFEKDRWAYEHCASNRLPLPRIFQIGRMGQEHYYCISEWLAGVTLQDVPRGSLSSLLAPTAQVMQAISETSLTDTTGFGPFTATGTGRYASWRDFLMDPISGASRHHSVQERKLQMVCRRLAELSSACGEIRHLVHGDFGSNNVLTDGQRITGVLDWSDALFGDPLYEVANIFFWRTHLACMEEQARYSERVLSKLAGVKERLLCYQLRIGLEEIRSSWESGRSAAASWATERCFEIAGET